jgi:hypothetical protein
MSALASAIHNIGHYHVRLGPVCLAPFCARIADDRRDLGTLDELAHIDALYGNTATYMDARKLLAADMPCLGKQDLAFRMASLGQARQAGQSSVLRRRLGESGAWR